MSKPVTDPFKLNIRAYFALDGNELDWRAPLLELLRSDAPIEPFVRARLAQRIEAQSKHEIGLELTGHQRAHNRRRRETRLHDDYYLGELVAKHIEAGATREVATFEVSEDQSIAPKTVDAALTFHKHAKAWIIEAVQNEAFATMGPQILFSLLVQRLTTELRLPDGQRLNEEIFKDLPPLPDALLKRPRKSRAASYRSSDP